MSFSLTPHEQARVDFAAALGIHLDPIGKHDLALIIFLSSIYLIDLVAVIYMLVNRKYPPIKSKSPGIMAAAYVSAIAWKLGDYLIDGHIHMVGPVLSNCKAFGVWLRLLLGVCAISALFALRSYGLYRVFCANLPYTGFGFYLPFMVYCACLLAYGIVIQFMSPTSTIRYVPELEACFYPNGFKGALLAFIWATWLFVAFINWKIRNIKSSFNESKEMALACFIVFTVLIYSTVIEFAAPYYPFNLTQRIVTTSLDHVAVNIVWWTIMGPPIFNCLFRRERYLEFWIRKLKRDGLQREYQIDTTVNATSVYSRRNTASRYKDPLYAAETRWGTNAFEAERFVPMQRPDSPTIEKHNAKYEDSESEAEPVSTSTHVDNLTLLNLNFGPIDEPSYVDLSPLSPATTVAGSIRSNDKASRGRWSIHHSLMRPKRQAANSQAPTIPRRTYSSPPLSPLQQSHAVSFGPTSPYQSHISYPEPMHDSSLRWQTHDEKEEEEEALGNRLLI